MNDRAFAGFPRAAIVADGDYVPYMAAPVFDLTTMTPSELLGLYSQILTELIDRKVVWSRNGDCPRNGVSGSTRRPVGWRGGVTDDRNTGGYEPVED